MHIAEPSEQIHRLAAGFDSASDAYERGRPSYPPDAVHAIIDRLGIGAGRRVLDLAAGTGKLTRLLVPTGADVVAVEPVAGMRRVLAQLVPAAQIMSGTAESIPLAPGSVDAVTVASAFHWFGGPAALAEVHRVLRPGGRLGLVWNVRDEGVAWVAELTGLLDAHAADAPRYRSGAWKAAFAGTDLFTPLVEEQFRHVHAADMDTLRDRVASISFIAALPTRVRADLLAQVEGLVRAHDAIGRDGRVHIPYRTDLYWCERVVESPR